MSTPARAAESLHDSVLQDLLAARQDVMPCIAGGGGVGPLLAQADAGIVDAVVGLRAAVDEPNPSTGACDGLDATLEALARAVAQRARFRVATHVDPGAACIHDRLLLSLAYEFLLNAERHAKARDVTVTIARLYGVVRLVVRDDGVGFTRRGEQEEFLAGHLGLTSARERVDALGGSLTVRSRPGEGTRVVALIPSRAIPVAGPATSPMHA